MRARHLLTFLVVLALPVVAGAQQKPAAPTPLVINLADGHRQTLVVDAGTYQIGLVNAVPGRRYFLRVGPSQPLALPVLPTASGAEEVTPLQECSTLTEATIALGTVVRETDVASLVDAVRLALVTAGKCVQERDNATMVVNRTRPEFPGAITLTAEAVRDLTISSGLDPHWRIRLNSAGRGTWQTSYGLVFNPNHDQEYFTEATGDGQFTVRRKVHDENSLTFLPSVFFNWLSSDQAFGNLQYGPTLGIGLTSDGGRIGGMLGWSLRFNQNIGVTAGVSVYPHRRLDARYHDGQVVKEALDSAQLNQDSMRANIFVAFTLRPGTSPFGK